MCIAWGKVRPGLWDSFAQLYGRIADTDANNTTDDFLSVIDPFIGGLLGVDIGFASAWPPLTRTLPAGGSA